MHNGHWQDVNPDSMHTLQPHGYRRGTAIWITAGRVCVFSCEFNGVCPQGGVSVRTREPSETTSESCLLVFPCFLVSEHLPVWTQLMLSYGTLTPSPSSSLTYSFCNLLTDRYVTIKSARACVCLEKMWFICRPERESATVCVDSSISVAWMNGQQITVGTVLL